MILNIFLVILAWWLAGLFSSIALCVNANDWREEFQFTVKELATCMGTGMGGLFVTILWLGVWLLDKLNEIKFWNKVIFTWKNK